MWLRHTVVELSVTLVILLATLFDMSWARWVVIVYTPFMLVLKLIALAGGGLLRSFKPPAHDVPAWFWHANYAVNVGLLLADAWWLLAAGWALIWLLSVIADARQRTPRRSSAQR